jgi:hypothetical protein
MRQFIALGLTFVLITVTDGCYKTSVHRIETQKVRHPEQEHIVGITTVRGEDVTFDQPPGGWIAGTTLHANVQGKAYQAELKDVQRLWVEKRGMSTLAKIGIVGGIVLVGLVVAAAVVAATKGSCPFVYSWDGERYVFDAEPYGGAIARGLERDDYAPLEHLRERDGYYRLLLTNEVDETQYTNLMELWVVDHPRGTRAGATDDGLLRTIAAPLAPVTAHNRAGEDLLPWLAQRDRLIWEPPAEPGAAGSTREEIILTFPKPARARVAKFEANAATSLWGSYMVRQMQALHGRLIPEWQRLMDTDQQAREELHAWGLREGIYAIPVEVEEEEGWVARGVLRGSGPVLAPPRVIALDVSRARGPQLRIRLRPAIGYWAFNSFAVDYTPDEPVVVTRVAPSSARDRQGRNVLAELAAADESWNIMPAIGDQVSIAYPAPPTRAGLSRTVFLHSRGYYRLHLPEAAEPELAVLERLRSEPGAAVRFAADRYADWKQQGGFRPAQPDR